MKWQWDLGYEVRAEKVVLFVCRAWEEKRGFVLYAVTPR
jgi:hypothetical protein